MCSPQDEPTQLGTLLVVVRGALQAFPYGGQVAAIWSDWSTHRRLQRIDSVVRALGEALESLGTRFDPERMGDAEMQILEAVLDRAKVEHRDRKRERFVRLLAFDWTEGLDAPFDERMHFVRALDALDELHIRILVYLSAEAESSKYPSYQQIAEAMQIPKGERAAQLIPALDSLASSFGFIRRAWGMSTREGKILLSTHLSPEGIARGCEHTITDMGRRFLRAVVLADE